MDVGDLLERQGLFWVVRKVEPPLRTALVEDQDAQVQHLSFEALDLYKRLCNPTRDWPSVTLPQGRHGRLTAISIAFWGGNRQLIRFKDWVRIDEFQIGGALYLNPGLGLGFRDRLLVTYADGACSSVDVPRSKAATVPAPVPQEPLPPPVSLLNRLLDDEGDE
jgi:hypothetical protein